MRFAAAVRTMVSDVGAGALLFLRFMPEPNNDESDFVVAPLATVASAALPAHAPRWETISVEADVPETADALVIGLVMTGNGAAWFGDLEFAAIRRPD